MDSAEMTQEYGLRAEGLTRRFGDAVALDGVDLAVAQGEMLTILGPSGSGKTTLLKIIAGFETPDEGDVYLSGRNVTFLAPAQRDIGMVFQNYALFPHMTVAENVAFPLQMRKVPKQERKERVAEALRLVDLGDFGERLPRQLSGGQQQRVALARAVVFRPRLLLLDEPFGALDRKLREQMQLEVRRLQRKLGLTAVFVTHDQEEALLISDRIAIVQRGRIAQIGTPQEIYRQPSNRFVAEFMGESNMLHGTPAGDGMVQLDGGHRIPVPARDPMPQGEIGLLLRPERAQRMEAGQQADTVLEGSILETIYLGETVKYRVALDIGLELIARWPFEGQERVLQISDRVRLGWNRNDVHMIAWAS